MMRRVRHLLWIQPYVKGTLYLPEMKNPTAELQGIIVIPVKLAL
jgi:hypothetical protein